MPMLLCTHRRGGRIQTKLFMFNVPEAYRVRRGPFATTLTDGNNGFFVIPSKGGSIRIHYQCIASDGKHPDDPFGSDEILWEHVSVVIVNISHSGKTTHENRCPTWEEMCYLKELFWDDPEDMVIQYHPPKSQYISLHPNCLHLWRPMPQAGGVISIPLPPKELVGFNPKPKENETKS
jgi:hypothetical protein